MDVSPDSETPLGKLVKSLPERLAERVLEDVMTGRLKPGDRLKEELLAQTHAVSRATVREALIALARQGYVVRIPRSGARIAEFSRRDLDDLFELRAALLATAAERYTRQAGPDQKAELEVWWPTWKGWRQRSTPHRRTSPASRFESRPSSRSAAATTTCPTCTNGWREWACGS